jgi:hypothetical protein
MSILPVTAQDLAATTELTADSGLTGSGVLLDMADLWKTAKSKAGREAEGG